MRYCTNCGFELEPDSNFCTNCGTPADGLADQRTEPESIQEMAEPEPEVMQNSGYYESNHTEAVSSVKTAAEIMQEEAQKAAMQSAAYSVNTGNTRYMSTTELWSWLKKDAKRQLFFTQEENTLTESDFIRKVAAKMWDNGVPAQIEKKKIEWDRSGIRDDCYIVSPYTNAVNPISYIIRFRHIGKFSFVEEKTFITPPDLPEVPDTPIDGENKYGNSVLMLTVGVILFFVGMMIMPNSQNMGMYMFMAGLLFTGVGGYNTYKYNEIMKHNKKCAEQLRAWNQAWNNWNNSVFTFSFQEDVNGQLSRIFDSIYGCIKQVSEEIFDEKPAMEDVTAQQQSVLEEMINRRREEYSNGKGA